LWQAFCAKLLKKNTALEKIVGKKLGKEPALEFVVQLAASSTQSPGQSAAVKQILELRQEDSSLSFLYMVMARHRYRYLFTIVRKTCYRMVRFLTSTLSRHVPVTVFGVVFCTCIG
jgi:hypothetical protein